MDGEEPRLLNVRETARRLGVHENTVRNWARSGLLAEARVPGSRFHRFRAEDVDRLIAQRGAAAPSLQTERRTVNPELIGASQLAQWPSVRARDAQDSFPELVRRLLVETPGISNISMRSGDGVALAGFDGLAEAEKNPFLPSGYLAFELGVSKDPRAKATTDYEGRIAKGRSNKIFVFITPGRWAGKTAWADERRREGHFADVCVLDADDLEGWLKAAPAAHYWISEHLGLRPRDAQTLDAWWSDFSIRTDPPLPRALFVAGRDSATERLVEQLKGAPKLTVIESESVSDCLGFLYASTHGSGAPSAREDRSIVVVSTSEVWERILEQPGQSILVPAFNDANVGPALDRGHHVISVVDRSSVSRRGVDISLPRLDRTAAAEAFQSTGIDFRKSDRLAALGRRSLPALVRQLSRNPAFSRPAWATGPDAAVLAPLVLVGSWTTSPQDTKAIERLTSQSHVVIDEACRRLSRTSDPVVRKVGTTWVFASPEEAFLLLRDALSPSAIGVWRTGLRDVLLEPDPMWGLSERERISAQLRNVKDRCSATLRRGLAQGLALMGAMGDGISLDDGSRLDDVAANCVRALLREANADESGRAWELIARELPLLAEAAPEEFLEAVADDLQGHDPVVLKLFQEDREDTLSIGPSSPHPSLLWAIETVTWSPQFLVDGARILARLAELEPGGTSGNRPASSLSAILCGWVRNTGAPLTTRLQAIDAAYAAAPSVGWRLIFDLWPSNRGWVMPPAEPLIRDDWRPTEGSVPMTDWVAFVRHLVDLAIEHAGTDPNRLRELVGGLATVSANDRERILSYVDELASSPRLDEECRLQVWDELNSIIARHERFPDAQWSLSDEALQPLRDLAAKLEPTGDPQRFAYLFDWHPDIPGVDQSQYDTYAARLSELRDEALQTVFAMTDPMGELAELASRVKVPGQLGWTLGSQDQIDLSGLSRWLMKDDAPLREVGLNYARRRMLLAGPDWLRQLLERPGPVGPARASLLAQIPPEQGFWDVLNQSPHPKDADTYWSTASIEVVSPADAPKAVDELVARGRGWTALGIVAHAIDLAERDEADEPPFSAANIAELLRQLLVQEAGDGEISQMSGYYLGRLLDQLVRLEAPKADIARFEFGFFRFLEHQREAVVLNEVLALEPELFVDLVKRVYRGKNESRRTKSDTEQNLATQAWWVLHGWKGYPGRLSDGTIDDAAMRTWVTSARLALADADRTDIGDEVIGQTFAHSPAGSDGIWPAEPVRELIESIGSRELENGLVLGRLNSRGVTTRGLYDGGQQERVLAAQYRDWSTSTKTSWPRTSRILRSIAESYERDAIREDLEAELDADQM